MKCKIHRNPERRHSKVTNIPLSITCPHSPHSNSRTITSAFICNSGSLVSLYLSSNSLFTIDPGCFETVQSQQKTKHLSQWNLNNNPRDLNERRFVGLHEITCQEPTRPPQTTSSASTSTTTSNGCFKINKRAYLLGKLGRNWEQCFSGPGRKSGELSILWEF